MNLHKKKIALTLFFLAIALLFLIFFVSRSWLPEKQEAPPVLSAEPWQFAGWYGGGAYTALVPDPDVKDRLYLLSDVAGIWRSDDRGDNWYFINNGLINLNMAVLAIAPSHSSVLYAGSKAGIMRSENSGQNWKYLLSTKDLITFNKPVSYRSIAVDHHDWKKVYAGNQLGEIFFSTDAGESWTKQESPNFPFPGKKPITSLLITRNGKTLFAGSEEGLIRYDPASQQWHDLGIRPVRDMILHGPEETLYVTAGKKIAISRNLGKTWEYSSPLPKGENSRLSVSKDESGQTWIAAGWKEGWHGGIFLTRDYGRSWKNTGRHLSSDTKSNPTRQWKKNFNRPNSIVFDPFNSKVIFFTDGWGSWRSDDRGKTWQEKIKGAPNSVGSDIVISPDGSIFAATMDNGLLKSDDSGLNWKAVCPRTGFTLGVQGHIWRLLFLDDSSQKFIATNSPWNTEASQLLLTEDGGENFQIIQKGLPSKYPVVNTMWEKGLPRALAHDPSDKNRIYLGIDGDDGGGLFLSNDGGKTWTRSQGQPDCLRIYNALAVDPTHPGTIFWGTYEDDDSRSHKGGVYCSRDYGQTWKKVLFDVTKVFDLAVTENGTVYCAGRNKNPVLYVSYDSGKNWYLLKKFKGTGTCEAVCIDPRDENKIFLGLVHWHEYTGGKIYASANGGKSWEDITEGLPSNSGPAAMTIHPSENMLYILLYSGSVYKRPLNWESKSQ